MISIFICGGYSSGMAKNIFSVHSDKWEYISSKIVSMSLVSALFILVYIIESIIALLFFTTGFSLTGGILEVVTDVMEIMKSEKWAILNLITHKYPIELLTTALKTASMTNIALNVIIDYQNEEVSKREEV